MARPDITLARLRELLHYEPQTGVFTRRVSVPGGFNTRAGDVAGTRCARSGYVLIMLDRKLYKAHRLAWLYVHERWPDGVIDHRNRLGFDNRIENLRDVPQGGNMENQVKARSKTGTGYLGVTRMGARFQARIQVRGKPTHIGTFETAEAAHAAYVAEKRRLHECGTL